MHLTCSLQFPKKSCFCTFIMLSFYFSINVVNLLFLSRLLLTDIALVSLSEGRGEKKKKKHFSAAHYFTLVLQTENTCLVMSYLSVTCMIADEYDSNNPA